MQNFYVHTHYCSILSDEEGMNKEARQLASKFISGMGGRVMDSFRHIKPDFKRTFGWFNRGAVGQGIRESENLMAGSGGISRPIAPSMASIRRVSNQALRGKTPAVSEDVLNRTGEASKGFWGKTKNKFNFSQPAEASMYGKLNDAQRTAWLQARQNVAKGMSPDEAHKQFYQQAFGKNMGTDQFNNLYGRWGSALGSNGEYIASDLGRRAGIVGGLLPFTAATFAPWTVAEQLGGLAAAPGAAGRAKEKAMEGVADQMYEFNNMPFFQRLKTGWNPQGLIEQKYQNNPAGFGAAHYYMYGPGKQERAPSAGIMDFLGEYAFPLFNGSYLDKAVNNKAINQFQKMGSFQKEAGRLDWVKEPITKAISKIPGMAKKVEYKKYPNYKPHPGHRNARIIDPSPSAASRAQHAEAYRRGKEMYNTFGGRVARAGKNLQNNWANADPMTKYIMGVGSGATLVGSGIGGYHMVNRGAENAGYNAGQAGALQTYANMPMWQRLGAAASPGTAMSRIEQQYPQLFDMYMNKALQYANAQPPAGLR